MTASRKLTAKREQNGKTQVKTAKRGLKRQNGLEDLWAMRPFWPGSPASYVKNGNHFFLPTSQKIDTFIDVFLFKIRLTPDQYLQKVANVLVVLNSLELV